LFIGATLPVKRYKPENKEQLPAGWDKKQTSIHKQNRGGKRNSPVDIRALARQEVEQLKSIEKLGHHLRQHTDSLVSLSKPYQSSEPKIDIGISNPVDHTHFEIKRQNINTLGRNHRLE
jgi:hypothetical protein